MKTLDIVTVGHFAIDHIRPSGAKTFKKQLGGSVAYVSFAAKKLGANVGVISKVGADFPKDYVDVLKRSGVDLFGLRTVRDAITTSFALEYQNESRELTLKSCAPPMEAKDAQLGFYATTVHVCPIADEVSLEVVQKLSEKTGTLSLDPQGLLRKFDVQGRTSLKEWKMPKFLELVDVYKSSLLEITALTGMDDLKASMRQIEDFGVDIVIVTLGSKGTMLLFDKTFHRIRAILPRKTIDPTGAGDVFGGAFLAEYLRNKDPLWCACVASAAASFKLETSGPVLRCTEGEIYGRAERCFDKVFARGDAQQVIDSI